MVSGTVNETEAQPAPALRPYVTSYVGFELAGFEPGVHLGTPSRALTVVVSLTEPLTVADRTDVRTAQTVQAVAGGLTSSSIAIRHDGAQHGVRLSLTPFGARAIFGSPAAALAHQVVDLGDVLGAEAEELVARLRGAPTWPARVEVLDAVLTRRAQRHAGRERASSIRPEIGEAWRRLVVHRGRLQVRALADDLGWSRRHLGEHFRREIGLTPKELAQVLRFEHACEVATAAHPPSWAEVAAVAGYADQAHLVREWRRFTGRTPSGWRRGEQLVPRRS